MTPDQEIERGEAARRILNEEVFKDAMNAIKKEIVDQWAATPARDTEGREWLWRHHQVALKFEEILTSTMNTGKLAAEQLRRERTPVERLFRR